MPTVLHVAVSGWLLGAPSGANRRLLALLAHLGPLLQPHERITVLHRPDWAPPPLPRIGFLPLGIPAAPALRRVLAERRLLPAALRALGANVLDHGFLPLPRVPVPACLLLHDLRGPDGESRWPRWLARVALRRSCARAAAVVVPSGFTAARLAVHAPHARAVVVGNGVVPPPPAASTSTTLPGHLLHVGHLEPRKNLAVVVQALARLPAARRPTLVLAGRDAGCAVPLQRLAARLGVAGNLQWRAGLADAEVAALLAAARAAVVPSRYEGFGLFALEALAAGRPTLVADAGALPEVAGGAATVLGPHDAAAWAAAIEATAHDPPAAAAARIARARAYGWPDAAARLLAVWRAVAATGRA